MPWRDDPPGLEAWRRGRTGYALVDAGMRQLWETGWMHNRVRMVTASFLTKDLLIDWRAGARWFWDTLVDADLANNTLGWQWVAGSGADAAPYHRVFNPDSQAARFDADGRYRERWLGDEERPAPMVDHRSARLRALAAHASATASRGR
jgi:deoxyribodipyrimidine photo-lyase